jgi:hypothetical protein
MDLTAKDLRAIELFKKYERHNLSENLKEYHFWIDTLIYLHETLSEQKVEIKYWQKPSETLLHKFWFHGLALHSILSGIKLQSVYYKEELNGKSIIDVGSAKVVLRAQLEAFLMYHHIYVNPDNDDVKELRFNAWIYSSLLQRQDFPAKTEYGKKQKMKDSVELEKMKSFITGLKSFKDLSTKQQQSLLDTGSGKLFNHWATILKETGFNEQNPFYTIYALLCIYAHSEGLSIIQMQYQPNGMENAVSQANLDLHNSKLLICLMINSIIRLYPEAKLKYDSLPDNTKYDLEIYCRMALSEHRFKGDN